MTTPENPYGTNPPQGPGEQPQQPQMPPQPQQPQMPPQPQQPQMPPQQQMPPQPVYQQPMPQPVYQQPVPRPAADRDSLIAALKDMRFVRFATLRLASVIYILLVVSVVLGWLAASVMLLMSWEPMQGVVVLLLGWIPAVFFILIGRVSLEAGVALIRTAQNTEVLAKAAEKADK